MDIRPSDGALLEELRELKKTDPGMGVHRLSASLHARQPEWRFNSKRVRSILKTHGMLCSNTGCPSDASDPSAAGSACSLAASPVTVDAPVFDDASCDLCPEVTGTPASSDLGLGSSSHSEPASDLDEGCFPCDEDYVEVGPSDWAPDSGPRDEEDDWVLLA